MTWSGQYDRFFIGGEWVSPSTDAKITVVSPTTEQVIATVPSATFADVDRAVDAARRAFDEGPWSRTTVGERVAVLRRLHELYAASREDLAQVITSEMGSPISFSRAGQVDVPLGILGAYLDVAGTYPFRELRTSRAARAIVTREPAGVVAAVTPWNVPQSVIMQKLAPALLSGCTIVLKPAPESPLDAYLLAELCQQAGVPDGVVNVVPADRESSEYLVTRPGVDKVSFTGSTAAGRRIASLCGNDLRRITLELGGKSAAIILEDADLDAAVETLRSASLRNSGQVCSLKTRIIVSRRQADEIVERLVAMVSDMPVGDPMDPATQIGPMVSERQRDRVESYIEIGQQEGATLAMGGSRAAGIDRGWFVAPTVFAGVSPQMRIAQEEIFGPVLSVLSYDDEDQAVAIANDSVYGLNGAVFSRDVNHAVEVASRIRTGAVEINGNPVGFRAPIGGFKESGIGREQGPEGLDAYVETKSVGLPAEYQEPEAR